MKSEDVEKILKIPPVAVYRYPGRTAEDLGMHSGDTDRFRIILRQTYPGTTSWAMNQESVMSTVCLTGTIRLFLEDESGFIELVPGAEVVIAKGKKISLASSYKGGCSLDHVHSTFFSSSAL
jgi:hypothetical protein